MKRTCKLSLSFLCFLICFLLSMSGIRARDEALAADIAPKILRFMSSRTAIPPETRH